MAAALAWCGTCARVRSRGGGAAAQGVQQQPAGAVRLAEPGQARAEAQVRGSALVGRLLKLGERASWPGAAHGTGTAKPKHAVAHCRAGLQTSMVAQATAQKGPRRLKRGAGWWHGARVRRLERHYKDSEDKIKGKSKLQRAHHCLRVRPMTRALCEPFGRRS